MKINICRDNEVRKHRKIMIITEKNAVQDGSSVESSLRISERN